jgi:hypothetical protein
VTKTLEALLLGERTVGSSLLGSDFEVSDSSQEPRMSADAAAPERLFKKSLLERLCFFGLLSLPIVNTSPDRIIYVDTILSDPFLII